MLDYKNKELKKFERRMSLTNKLILEIDPQDQESVKLIENLKNYSTYLESAFLKIKKTKTWPYNINYEATYLISLSIPFISFILKEFGEKIDLFDILKW